LNHSDRYRPSLNREQSLKISLEYREEDMCIYYNNNYNSRQSDQAQWLTPVFLATQEANIVRIVVRGQLRQNS
jgi:hypothetical protein